MSAAQSNAIKVIALSAASIALLSACGEPKATPMDDEYAGNSGESVQSQENKSKTDGKAADNTAGGDATTKNHADDANSTTSDKQDTGNYADGDYSVNGQYGPVGEDTIDVHLTVKDQNVTAVKIVGHPFTSISKKHQNDFAKAVPDAVVGKPLKDLKVDKLAGASWTSEAFNKALEVARQEASLQLPIPSETDTACPSCVGVDGFPVVTVRIRRICSARATWPCSRPRNQTCVPCRIAVPLRLPAPPTLCKPAWNPAPC